MECGACCSCVVENWFVLVSVGFVSGVRFAGNNVAVKVWVACSAGCVFCSRFSMIWCQTYG